MTQSPPAGVDPSEGIGVDSTQNATIEDLARDRWFTMLETGLAGAQEMSVRMARKHWQKVESEKYPFWAGILLIAILGIWGMLARQIQWLGLIIAILMLIGLLVVIAIYLRSVAHRFDRLWAEAAADGELFKYLRDAGAAIGHPIEMGREDEQFSTHLTLEFPASVHTVEMYLKMIALPDPVRQYAAAGIFPPIIQPESAVHRRSAQGLRNRVPGLGQCIGEHQGVESRQRLGHYNRFSRESPES